MPSSTDDLRSFFNNDSQGQRPAATRPRPGASRPNDGRRGTDPHGRSETQRSAQPDRGSAAQVALLDDDRRQLTDTSARDLDGIAVTDVVDRAGTAPAVSAGVGIGIEPVAMGARPTSTLQKAWIDPEETPFEPVARPGNPVAARLISWIAVFGLLCGLGWLILPELNLRLASLDTVELRQGVLSAQPVQLSPLRPAIVSELFVDASTLPDGVLPKGSTIALLEGTSEDGKRMVTTEVNVPFDARFVSVDTLVGGVVMPGTPVATIYDPSQMYVIVTVQPEMLDVISRGMKVRLHSDVAGADIKGEVISAVPLLGTDHEPTTANLVNIRIKPDPAGVADLVPGIRFDAIIDLTSAPANAQPLVFTYAGHVDPDGTAAQVANDKKPGNG